MPWFFLWIMWLLLLFRVIGDIFRSDDLGGVAKVVWLIIILVLTFRGVFVYVIARGNGMGKRDMQRAVAAEDAFKSYVQEAAGTGGGGTASELAKLAELKDRGVLSEAEFQQQKAKLLAWRYRPDATGLTPPT